MSFKPQIRQFITTNFYVIDPAGLTDEASLMEHGIVDSTGMLDLILFLEREFKIQVDDTEMLPENLDSIANLDAYVARKQGGQPAAS